MKKKILLPLAIVIAVAAVTALWIFSPRPGTRASPPADIHADEAKASYNCAMHPQYISDRPGNCPICGMKLTRMDKPSGGAPGRGGVHIDPATMQNMGVRTELVRKRELRTEIRTNGKVKVDESKLTIVNARVMGYAEKLIVSTTGQKVKKGQSLLEIYSPDLVSTQEEYLQALRYARGLAGSEGTGAADLVESSRRRLLNWGVSPAEIGDLEKLGYARNTLAIASPASGVVLEKMVVQGQNITPGMELYKIADLSKVWVVAGIYQRDLAVARVGAEAEVELSYLPGKPFHGKVTFVSPVLDEQTKTAEVRIEIENTASLDFKPEMFATVTLRSAAHMDAIAIPDQAIIRSGRRTLAIVATGGGYFEPREVKLGASAGEYVEILDGLREGERLVISSQFLIDSESNLKAAIQKLQATSGGPTPKDDPIPQDGPGPAEGGK
jgi:multidrug efflux pump subunit AcrA (membrane-fusion protein)